MRAWLYNKLVVSLTSKWYKEVFLLLPEKSTVLDVGVGTGGALLANSELIRDKELNISGIDIDIAYLKHCQKHIQKQKMETFVKVWNQSIYDMEKPTFDIVYFSGSFMLLPDPEKALEKALSLLNPGGKIVFTQTFDIHKTKFWEFFKPLLFWVTSVRFGKVTYENELPSIFERFPLTIEKDLLLRTQGTRKMKLIIVSKNDF